MTKSREYQSDHGRYYEFKQTPEEHGEIALELYELRRTAKELENSGRPLDQITIQGRIELEQQELARVRRILSSPSD